VALPSYGPSIAVDLARGGWFKQGMTRSVPATQIPALILALLAVLGLLSRGQPASAGPNEMMVAGFRVALCHAGSTGHGPADRPMADCDACLLCVAVHAATPLLPACAGLPPVSVAALLRPMPPVAAFVWVAAPQGTRARGPPSAA
jgi:hypothetical protein